MNTLCAPHLDSAHATVTDIQKSMLTRHVPASKSEIPAAAIIEQGQKILKDTQLLPAYRAALSAALELPGNLLSDVPNLRWARIVWTCCVAAGGHGAQAIPVAAAVELFMVALDLLDDAEDGEFNPLHATIGPARTLNVSTGLLLLAQQWLLASPNGATAAHVLISAGIRACNGQDADLSGSLEHHDDLHAALAITSWKSASLVAAACRLGAISAGADAATQSGYERLGSLIGMMAQLINDIRALAPTADGKTDIALRRPTLPLTYLQRQSPTAYPIPDDVATRAKLWTSTPVYLTWVVVETYRSQAFNLIAELTSDSQHQARLAALLPRMHWTHKVEDDGR